MADFNKIIEESYEVEKNKITFSDVTSMIEELMLLQEELGAPLPLEEPEALVEALPMFGSEVELAKKFLNQVPGTDLFEKLQSLEDLLNSPRAWGGFIAQQEEVRNKEKTRTRQAISTYFTSVYALKYMLYLFKGLSPQTLGFFNETFFATLMGGSKISLGGGTIADYRYEAEGDKFISLKTIAEDSKIEGSLREMIFYDLLPGIQRDPEQQKLMQALHPDNAGATSTTGNTTGKVYYQIVEKVPGGGENRVEIKCSQYLIDATDVERFKSFLNALDDDHRKLFKIPTDFYLTDEEYSDIRTMVAQSIGETEPGKENATARRSFNALMSDPKNRASLREESLFHDVSSRMTNSGYALSFKGVGEVGVEGAYIYANLFNNDAYTIDEAFLAALQQKDGTHALGQKKSWESVVFKPFGIGKRKNRKKAVQAYHDILKAHKVGSYTVEESVYADYGTFIKDFYYSIIDMDKFKIPLSGWKKNQKQTATDWTVGGFKISSETLEDYIDNSKGLFGEYLNEFKTITLSQVIVGLSRRYSAPLVNWAISQIQNFEEEMWGRQDPQKVYSEFNLGTPAKFRRYVESSESSFGAINEANLNYENLKTNGFDPIPTAPRIFYGDDLRIIPNPGQAIEAALYVVGNFYDEVRPKFEDLSLTNRLSPKVKEKTGRASLLERWKDIEEPEDLMRLPVCYGMINKIKRFNFNTREVAKLAEATNGGKPAEIFTYNLSQQNWDGIVEASTSKILGRIGNILNAGKELFDSMRQLTVDLGNKNYKTKKSIKVLEAYSNFTSALSTTQKEDDEDQLIFAKTYKDDKVKRVRQYKVTE